MPDQSDPNEISMDLSFGDWSDAVPPGGSGRFIAYRDLVEMDAWPVADCTRTIPVTKQNYIFVSHAWLAPHHPDPEGRKLYQLKLWWHELTNFHNLLSQISPAAIGQHQREYLCWKRVQIAPILLYKHAKFWEQQYRGFGTSTGSWLDDDTEPAAREFLAWLTETVTAVLSAHLWIDSWATGGKQHRRDCSFCSEVHHQTIYEIPNILANADACLFLGGFSADELRRGWVVTELCCAQVLQRLQSNVDQLPFAILFERLESLVYECSDEKDGYLLPRLFAAQRCRSEFEQSRPEHVFGHTDRHGELLAHVLSAVTEDSGCPIEDSVRIIETLRSERVCRQIDVAPVHGGRMLINSMEHGLLGVFRAHARRERSAPPPYSVEARTQLKACLFAAIARGKLPSREATCFVIRTWTAWVDWQPCFVTATEPSEGERWSQLVRLAKDAADFWLRREENTIDITLSDIALYPVAPPREDPDHGRGIIEVQVGGDEVLERTLIRYVVEMVSHEVNRLGIGDAMSLHMRTDDHRVLESIQIEMFDGRLWLTALRALEKVHREMGRPIVVTKIKETNAGLFERHPSIDVRSG